MNVEIAICTYNRCASLDKTLHRLADANCSDCDSLRVLIVDNNCNDQTADVVRQHSDNLEILYLKESNQGQVFARNTAIEAAAGELLIWTDDDVNVSDIWLSSYVAAARSQTDYSFWGGPIQPVFENERPKWIADHWDKLCGCFAERQLGAEPFDFTPECLPYGANFAIRTSIQKQHPFATNLGRTDTSVLGEDELTLLRTVLQAGHKGSWLPDAAVDHMIDASRATTQYVGSYFRGQGQALALKGEAWTSDLAELEREMNHELKCFTAKRLLSRSDVWLSHLLRGSLAAGQLDILRSR